MSAFTHRPHSRSAGWARPDCSVCHGSITWHSAADLAWQVHSTERLRVFELVDFCGPRADAWFCPHCGCWGVFGERE